MRSASGPTHRWSLSGVTRPHPPRSQSDYIEIARSFHTVLVSGVPEFTPGNENETRRFIALVDEFYDRNVKLILSAAVPLYELYRSKRLAFEFCLRSVAYLASPHLP
jgi:cell division protein ZapE